MEQRMIIISEGDLTAEIAPLGAELQSLAHDGHGALLWDGDPAFWTGRAPVLFPIVGSLAGDSYRYDGRSYTLPKHGFARRSLFTPVSATPSSATLRLEASDETRAHYPFDFRLDMHFALAGQALTMEACLTNTGAKALPASFGFHPALRWPLPYGAPRAEHRIRFAEAEPEPIRRIDASGLVRPASEATPVEGRELLLRDALFEDDALIFDRPHSRSLVYGAPGSPALEIDYPDMPQLGIWMKPGAGYVCIEPWQGTSDPQGFAGDIFEKPGIVALAPGEERRFTMRIALRAEFG